MILYGLTSFIIGLFTWKQGWRKKGGGREKEGKGVADEGMLGFSHILSIFLKHIKSWLPKGNASNAIY